MITFADLIDHVVVYAGRDNTAGTVDSARRAAQQACSNMASRHDWRWYRSALSIPISQPYSTGTILYNATTRTVTLTGGTWPTWATYGLLRINDIDYLVQTRTSGTVIVLDPNNCLTTNLVVATTYQLIRYSYALPDNFDAAIEAVRQPYRDVLVYRSNPSSPTSWISNSSQTWYTTNRDKNRNEGHALWLGGRTTITGTVTLNYRRRIPILRYDRSENGTFTVSNASNAVTGFNTKFRSDMVDQVLRLSGDGLTYPTGLFGNSPYLFESKIATYVTAESLTVVDAATEDLTSVKGIISSELDCSNGPMWDYLLREAERQFRIVMRMQPSGKEELAAFQMSLETAKDEDSRYTGTSSVDYGTFFPMDYTVSNTVV